MKLLFIYGIQIPLFLKPTSPLTSPRYSDRRSSTLPSCWPCYRSTTPCWINQSLYFELPDQPEIWRYLICREVKSFQASFVGLVNAAEQPWNVFEHPSKVATHRPGPWTELNLAYMGLLEKICPYFRSFVWTNLRASGSLATCAFVCVKTYTRCNTPWKVHYGHPLKGNRGSASSVILLVQLPRRVVSSPFRLMAHV